jgi:ubiquitin-like 1-activating enzyme E1 A
MAGAADGELTAEQRAVYDRQLRVWGVEAQRRLGRSSFFVAGLTGLSAEACKNVVLAGIGSVTLFDDGALAKDAHPGNFLAHAGLADHEGEIDSLTVAQATAATLREMNPFGKVHTVSSLEKKDTNEKGGRFSGVTVDMLRGMDVVLLTNASVADRMRIGDMAREVGASIFAGAVRGYAADFLADFGETFESVVESSGSAADESGSRGMTKTTRTTRFVSLRTALSSNWSDLAVGREGGMRRVNRLAAAATTFAKFELENRGRFPDARDVARLIEDLPALEKANGPLVKPGWMKAESLVEYAGAVSSANPEREESPAVAAVVGGVLANEMLRAVTKIGEPARNGFFFSATNGQGTIENLGCGAP